MSVTVAGTASAVSPSASRSCSGRNTTVPVPNAAGGLTNHYPLRASTHLWHDRRDVDRLVESCVDLATRMSRGQ